MSGNGILNPNTVQPFASTFQILSVYPFRTVRKDLTQNEYLQNKLDWTQFDNVWAYNYTVSTLNGQAGRKVFSPYYFIRNEEKLSYLRGQSAHIAAYSTIATTGIFNNIS
jgi:hypothetical protein